jgi:hypothetical protein
MIPYHLIIRNVSPNDKRAVLFGAEFYSKEKNYGSDIAVFVNTADKATDYLFLLNQSIEKEFKATGIRIITDSWSKMPKSIYYKDLKSGNHQTISLVNSETWGKQVILNKAVNDIPLPKLLINGQTKFILQLEPNSEIELLIY